ncbi:unnamed protein product [Adineta ricciae]|uniref:Uncharacterized protein n=1 Tax=Adineta ricciae TaxID=249248 RepID=A0A814RNL2_ADIRI|nr:unnamed protein product [Adineta ricciae]CAF1337661.1 unnamed protein product [Adineta ricciae]
MTTITKPMLFRFLLQHAILFVSGQTIGSMNISTTSRRTLTTKKPSSGGVVFNYTLLMYILLPISLVITIVLIILRCVHIRIRKARNEAQAAATAAFPLQQQQQMNSFTPHSQMPSITSTCA